MTFVSRWITVLTVAAGLVAAGAGTAAAEPRDERFAAAVDALGIPYQPDTDLAAVGNHICDMLRQGLSTTINPVPVVRGVVNQLTGPGIDRGQAAGLMRAAVEIYCPQYARYTGR